MAICETCAQMVSMTFRCRDVQFDDGSGIVEGILVGVCDDCDTVVAAPPQSPPAIRKALHQAIQ